MLKLRNKLRRSDSGGVIVANTEKDRISIEEIAQALQVSKTTVSRALSGKGRISESTRKRVRDYVTSTGASGPATRPPTT